MATAIHHKRMYGSNCHCHTSVGVTAIHTLVMYGIDSYCHTSLNMYGTSVENRVHWDGGFVGVFFAPCTTWGHRFRKILVDQKIENFQLRPSTQGPISIDSPCQGKSPGHTVAVRIGLDDLLCEKKKRKIWEVRRFASK